jgi:hypothetical protein
MEPPSPSPESVRETEPSATYGVVRADAAGRPRRLRLTVPVAADRVIVPPVSVLNLILVDVRLTIVHEPLSAANPDGPVSSCTKID